MYEICEYALVTEHHAYYGFRRKVTNLRLNIRNVFTRKTFRNLPAKAQTESRRRKDRDAAKEKAKEFLRAGKTEEARKEFTKAVDITHNHAVDLMKECRKVGVDCITAMYEADSQLAYLNKIGAADYVISEDSDLILFGCSKVIFKLQLDGRCLLFDSEKLHLTINTTKEKFCFEKFRRICILSGCDYLDNLHGIGLSKARKFMLLTEETDLRKALPKIPSYLNMKKLTILPDYIEGFLKAEATFKHMFVYDPLKREMTRLNPLGESDSEVENCSNAGELLENATAYQLALGNLNPRTFEISDDYDPDTIPHTKKFRKHLSIWRKDFVQASSDVSSRNFKHQSSISNFFSNPKKFNQMTAEVQTIIAQENDVTENVEIGDLVSSYCIQTSSAKRRNIEFEIDESKDESKHGFNDVTPTRNPFAKRHQAEKTKLVDKPSLLESLACKEVASKFNENQHRTIVSKYFPINIAQKTFDESEALTKMNKEIQERQLKNKMFYELAKNQQEHKKDDPESQVPDDVGELSECSEVSVESQGEEESSDLNLEINTVDLDKYQFQPKSQKQTFINDIKPKAEPKATKAASGMRRPGLTKIKSFASQKSDSSTSLQTKLSKFGFLKKSSLN